MGDTVKKKKTWLHGLIEAYQQQKSWVWTPVYTVHTMWAPFLGMGCVMLVLGLVLLGVQGGYNEIEWDYTDCKCNGTEAIASEYLQKYPGSPCKCIKEVNITEENDNAKWDRDVMIYYGLENFHQNHRQYADSRDDKQLDGRRLNADGDPDIPFSDCEDPNNNFNSSAGKILPIMPCGSIAKSFFNDEVKMYFQNSTCKWQPITLLKTGIAMPLDKKRFNNPVNNSELKEKLDGKIFRPKGWTKHLWELDPLNPSNNGLDNEDLIVWMRSASLANFRKLWRRVDHNDKKHIELKDGLHTAYVYKLEIDYKYDVSGFEGRKKIIITRANLLGAKTAARGYIAIAAAVFFFSFSALFKMLASHVPRS